MFIIRAQIHRVLHAIDALIDGRPGFVRMLQAQVEWQGIGFTQHFPCSVLVEPGKEHLLCFKGTGPVDDAGPVARCGISRRDLNMLLEQGYRFFELCSIKWRAGQPE
jgi:hypothetical protein